jgi:hypothetical protein
MVFCEKHADQPGAPASVFRTHGQGFFDQGRNCRRSGAAAVDIVRRQLRGVVAKPADEMANRSHGQVQFIGNRRSILLLLKATINYLANGKRNGTWHCQSSLNEFPCDIGLCCHRSIPIQRNRRCRAPCKRISPPYDQPIIHKKTPPVYTAAAARQNFCDRINGKTFMAGLTAKLHGR